MIKRLLLFFHLTFSCVSAQIINYEKFIAESTDLEEDLIVLRKLEYSDKNIKYIGLHPNNLELKIIESKQIKERDWDFLEKKYSNTVYIKLRSHAKKKFNYSSLKNSGIKNLNVGETYILTTDLCPVYYKSLNYKLYNNFSEELSHPVPIGIAITGRWMNHHKDGLEWLLDMQKKNVFKITWINHSYNHKYIEGKAISSNFLLIKNTDLDHEVLDLEKLMINNNLNISIYFRFPGLISNEELYNKVLGYGLIPLGSDSWIGKGRLPKNGSIVLVHGNGNDIKGVAGINKWFKTNENKLNIKSINQTVIDFFE